MDFLTFKNSRGVGDADWSLRQVVRIVFIALIIIFSVRYFLLRPFTVEGRSMQPNFKQDQYLIVDELSYHFKDPERGEVVVFKYEEDSSVKKANYLIKRIIGLPGERIKIFGGKIMVYTAPHPEGVLLDETYLSPQVQTSGEKEITLEKDTYYVLGDNRPESKDSRYFGPVHRSQIVGRVFLRGWPFNEVQVFTTPPFNF